MGDVVEIHLKLDRCRRIGVFDLQLVCVDNQNSFAHCLENRAVPRFGLPHQAVIMLKFLLNFQRALLQFGGRAQIPPKCDHPVALFRSDRAIGNRQFLRACGRMVHMPGRLRRQGTGPVEQGGNLGPALDRHGLGPFLTDPAFDHA